MATTDKRSPSIPHMDSRQDRTPSDDRYADMSAPRRTVAPAALATQRREPIKVGPPSFSGRFGDSLRSKRAEVFSRRQYFEGALGYARNIAVGHFSCSNEHEPLANHDPDMIARARLAYFSIQDACASGAARRVITILKGSRDRMKAFNGSFGSTAVGQGLSLQAELSQARIKPEPSPSNFHQ